MLPTDLLALVAGIPCLDPAGCDQAALTALVDATRQARGAFDAWEACIAIAASELASAGSCEAPEVLLASNGRSSARDGKTVAQRGVICGLMPLLHEALAAGAVSAGHVDAVARVAGRLKDDVRSELVGHGDSVVEWAMKLSVESFEQKICRFGRMLSRDDGVGQHERMRRERSIRRWVDRQTGMCHTHVILDPESDARFSAALDAAVAAEQAKPDEGRTFDELKVDAFMNLVTGARGTGRRPAEISVLIDYQTIVDGLHDHSVCETSDGQPIPPETVRRLACDAGIIPIVLNGIGVPLDLGHSSRVATKGQRDALRATYRTCGHPGCQVRFNDCQMHHVIEWTRAGPTNLANLLPLCGRHHHLVHEGGWHLTLNADRRVTLTRPDGTISFDGSTVDVAPHGTGTTAEHGAPARVRAGMNQPGPTGPAHGWLGPVHRHALCHRTRRLRPVR